MRALTRVSVISLLAVASCNFAHSQEKQSLVEGGKYIVEVMARREVCHTPRDEHAKPDRGR